MTLERVADRAVYGRPLIVAHRDHRYLLGEALRVADVEADLLLEPVRRDTAAAIVSAATIVARRDRDAVLLVLAADHLISDHDAFAKAVDDACAATERDYIVTFGVVPDAPATSYGYIRRSGSLPGLPTVSGVATFAEKPDAATARKFVDAGYLWNSGNFMMRASVAIAETKRYEPEIAAAATKAAGGVDTVSPPFLLAGDPYEAAPAMSFDHAVMERTERAAVVEARFDWRDIGSWDSLGAIAEKDAAGNATVGEVAVVDSRGSYVHAASGQVAILGVDNLVVATGGDAVLVAARDRLDAVKALISDLDSHEAEDRSEEIYKVSPWGYFQMIDGGNAGYKVKRIVVEPGARLSLQKHKHRAEHWVVVTGVAEVTVDDDVRRLEENQSIFIPLGAVHRLANPGDRPLTVIEVQYGDYLGDDDIERLSDDYDRAAQ